MRLGRLAAAVLAVAATVTGPAVTPAHATAAAAGNATFEGTAYLPKFPCPPPPPFGTGPCVGNFVGQWAGHLAGAYGTSAFDVTWSTLTGNPNLAIQVYNFQYAEWQCAAGTETVLGIAQGSGTATVDPGFLQGKWQVPGELFARDVIGLTLSFTFQWTRLASEVVIVLPTSTLQINVSGLGWKTVVVGTQTGTASFAPTSSSGGGVPSCSNPLTNVTGAIAGNLVLAGTA